MDSSAICHSGIEGRIDFFDPVLANEPLGAVPVVLELPGQISAKPLAIEEILVVRARDLLPVVEDRHQLDALLHRHSRRSFPPAGVLVGVSEIEEFGGDDSCLEKIWMIPASPVFGRQGAPRRGICMAQGPNRTNEREPRRRSRCGIGIEKDQRDVERK
jgi:hypothetical protein